MDVIDVMFHFTGTSHQCTFRREGGIFKTILEKEENESAGLDFEPMRFKKCGNRCVFCFVDQNPEGLRPTLYFKDEDYRLSFLHGCYVTLTHLSAGDLDRIIRQRLSPLFVSIHAVNPEVRTALLGLDREDHLVEKLRCLTEGGIEIHGQIVLCPGLNDGNILDETVDVLADFYPGIRSLSVVPVGLTRYRDGLPFIQSVDAQYARRTIKQIRPYQRRFRRRMKERFVYLSDEFYLLANASIPDTKQYGEFWQIENGVGLTRFFLNRFREQSRSFPDRLSSPQGIVLVTGTLAAPVFEKTILSRLRRIRGLDVSLCTVSNRFYGDTVTVSGLLTGKDILDTCASMPKDHILVLPAHCLNSDGLFLDDRSTADLERMLGNRVLVVENFQSLFEKLDTT